MRVGVLHRVVDRGLVRRVRLAEAHADDLRAVVHRVANRVGDVLVALVAVGHRANHHELDGRRDAVDADSIAADRADDPGHVRPVLGVLAHHVRVAVVVLVPVGVVVADDRARIEVGVEAVLELSLERLESVVEHGLGVAPSSASCEIDLPRLRQLRGRRRQRAHAREAQRVGRDGLLEERHDLMQDVERALVVRDRALNRCCAASRTPPSISAQRAASVIFGEPLAAAPPWQRAYSRVTSNVSKWTSWPSVPPMKFQP